MKIIGSLIIIFSLHLVFADVVLTSRVDRTQIALDETVVLVIEIKSDTNINIPQFDLPQLVDFDVVGSSRSYRKTFINGKIDNVLESRFDLVPKKIGQLTIPSLEMKIKNQNLSTQQILLNVQKNKNEIKPSTEMKKNSVYADVFVDSETDKQEYYFGEPILYTLKFYTRTSFFNGPALNEASLNNLKKASNIKNLNANYSKELGGKQYSVSEIKTLYFPEIVGNALFGKTSVVYSFSPFERNKQVNTGEILLKIKSIPKKENYNYAVGDFNLDVSIDKNRVDVNEGVYMHVNITGYGNLRESIIGSFNLGSDLEQFDPKINLNEEFSSNGLYSKKTFDYLFVPRTEGTFNIPKISFTYFSPSQNQFVIISSKPIKLSVRKSKLKANNGSIKYDNAIQMEVLQEHEDIQYIKNEIGHTYDIYGQKVKIVILLISALLFIWTILGNIIFFFVLRLFVSGPDRLFYKRFKNIKKDPLKFYDLMYTLIIEYISGKKKIISADLNKLSIQKIIGENANILETIKYFEEKKYMPKKDYEQKDFETDCKKAISCFKEIKRILK